MVTTNTKCGRAAVAASLAVVSIALAVLLGWLLDWEPLKRLAPGMVAMNPATAVGLAMAAASLALTVRAGGPGGSRSHLGTARLLALVPALIGLLRLVALWGGWKGGVDRWLFAAAVSGEFPLANRMAPSSALNLLLVGSALSVGNARPRSARFLAEMAAFVMASLSLLAVLGYAYGLHSLSDLGSSAPMALHSALAMLLLSVALLVAHTDRGWLAVFAEASALGTMARRLLPVAVLVPAGMGFLTHLAAMTGFLPGLNNEALLTIGNIVLFATLAGWGVRGIARAERHRGKAESEAHASEQRYRSLVEATAAIVWETPASGEFESPQPQWSAFTGQSFAELRGTGWLDAVHPDDRAETVRVWAKAVAECSTYEVSHRLRNVHQVYREMMVRAVPVLGEGSIRQWIGVHTDVTEQRIEERELLWKSAFLETQMNSTIDGILIVDAAGCKILQNGRASELLKIPQHPAGAPDGGQQLDRVIERAKDPVEFQARVASLAKHPSEFSLDEIEFVDGAILERYSAPLVGKKGAYYGRVWTFRDISARRRAEETLRLFGSVVEQSTESIVITDAMVSRPGPRILFVNPAFTAMTGFTAAEAQGQTPRMLQGPRTDRAVLDRLRKNLEEGETFEGETVNYRKNGEEFVLEWLITPIRDRTGKVTHFVALQRDITARKRLEVQLQQSQKMEMVGKLAGGVAHEFNSIMTAIIGQSELLLADLSVASPLRHNASEIRGAAARAAGLTRQLLAYGRKQILQPAILDLNALLASMESALRHVLGRACDVVLSPAVGLKPVKVDLGQIEDVILHIAMNAAEAMPKGGRLTIETGNVTLDESYVSRIPELAAGEYVVVAISDTGLGMSEEVKARLFEPFFSTKPVGQGTGLGLSTCYGIIKQSGGHIAVYSEISRGASFKIYLPQAEAPAKNVAPRAGSLNLPSGTETILLVEDDPALRDMAATLLERLGYTVLAAANGIEAMSLRQQGHSGHIDLLFTDLVMPHMGGKELAGRILSNSPHTKVLFTSAYTENAMVHQGILPRDAALLQKPFTPSALALRLRQVLDREDG